MSEFEPTVEVEGKQSPAGGTIPLCFIMSFAWLAASLLLPIAGTPGVAVWIGFDFVDPHLERVFLTHAPSTIFMVCVAYYFLFVFGFALAPFTTRLTLACGLVSLPLSLFVLFTEGLFVEGRSHDQILAGGTLCMLGASTALIVACLLIERRRFVNNKD